jgi:hypothetical protein
MWLHKNVRDAAGRSKGDPVREQTTCSFCGRASRIVRPVLIRIEYRPRSTDFRPHYGHIQTEVGFAASGPLHDTCFLLIAALRWENDTDWSKHLDGTVRCDRCLTSRQHISRRNIFLLSTQACCRCLRSVVAFAASQKAYWQIKQKFMDVILFFKIGTFYELYEVMMPLYGLLFGRMCWVSALVPHKPKVLVSSYTCMRRSECAIRHCALI